MFKRISEYLIKLFKKDSDKSLVAAEVPAPEAWEVRWVTEPTAATEVNAKLQQLRKKAAKKKPKKAAAKKTVVKGKYGSQKQASPKKKTRAKTTRGN